LLAHLPGLRAPVAVSADLWEHVFPHPGPGDHGIPRLLGPGVGAVAEASIMAATLPLLVRCGARLPAPEVPGRAGVLGGGVA